jgi:hypothetical protein
MLLCVYMLKASWLEWRVIPLESQLLVDMEQATTHEDDAKYRLSALMSCDGSELEMANRGKSIRRTCDKCCHQTFVYERGEGEYGMAPSSDGKTQKMCGGRTHPDSERGLIILLGLWSDLYHRGVREHAERRRYLPSRAG